MPSRDAGSSALRYVVVDVFTEKLLEGNQLGVFLDARSLSSEQMQRLAREMNFAESVFVLPPGNGADARIRIFTPATELPFAGHPVLGSAAGPLAVHLARHGRIGFGEEIEIRQGAEIRRPSILYARADGSADRIERDEVGGSAVIVARGEFERY